MRRLLLAFILTATMLMAGGRRTVAVGPDDKVLSHIAYGQGWDTTITLVNVWSEPATFWLRFFDDNGNPLTVPVEGRGNISVVTDTIPVNGSRTFKISTSSPTLVAGWAELDYDWSAAEIGGMAIFRLAVAGRPDLEAVVPMSSLSTSDSSLPFDNTGGMTAGMAIANSGGTSSTVTFQFFDENGVSLGEEQTIVLAPKGHKQFMLPDQFPIARGKKGVINIQSSNSKVAVLGLRVNASGSLTSMHSLDH